MSEHSILEQVFAAVQMDEEVEAFIEDHLEQGFTQFLDMYRLEFPNCAKLCDRELKILAGAAVRLPHEVTFGTRDSNADEWLMFKTRYDEQLAKVKMMEKGVVPNYQTGKSEYFRLVYGGHGPRNEASLREFVNIRLGEPWKSKRRERQPLSGQHLCPRRCPGGCEICCPGNMKCPGCLVCNASHKGLPTNQPPQPFHEEDLDQMRLLLNCLYPNRERGGNMVLQNEKDFALYVCGRVDRVPMRVFRMSEVCYKLIRDSHPEWLGLPPHPMTIKQQMMNRQHRPAATTIPDLHHLAVLRGDTELAAAYEADMERLQVSFEIGPDAQVERLIRQKREAVENPCMKIGRQAHEDVLEIGKAIDVTRDSVISRQLAERDLQHLRKINNGHKWGTSKGEPSEPYAVDVHIDPLLKDVRDYQVALAEMEHRPGSMPCPDCLTTPGKYVGLTVTEDCRRCGGSTRVMSIE